MRVNFREKRAVLDGFSAQQLLGIGLPHIEFYNHDGQYQALCPFHSDSHIGSFGYNPSKNCWSCFVCGESGQGVYSLIMKVKGWDFKKTIDYLYDHRSEAGTMLSSHIPSALKPRTSKPHKQAGAASVFAKSNDLPSHTSTVEYSYNNAVSAKDKHLIYQCFSNASPLSAAERSGLCLRRCLHYFSVKDFFRFPLSTDGSFWTKFRAELAKHDVKNGEERLFHQLLGVPGFFWNLETQSIGFVGYGNSLGILSHDIDGLINGIELRLRTVAKDAPRYIPFSSDGICARYPEKFTGGTRLGPLVDLVYKPAYGNPYQGIAITEGKFKAIQLSYLGYTVLNIRGVANWRQSLHALQCLREGDYDTSKVSIVFDADSRCNPPVAKHARALGEELLSSGYETLYLSWPNNLGKGIDDVVTAGYKHTLRSVPAEKYINTTLSPFIARVEARRAMTNALSAMRI